MLLGLDHGFVRDFTEETLTHIRENLVDRDTDWDAASDFRTWLTYLVNSELREKLQDFDNYMREICEINDITAAKLDTIVAEVHAVETAYAAKFEVHFHGLRDLYGLLSTFDRELRHSDPERGFDTSAVLSRWEGFGMSGEEFLSFLASLTNEQLSALDVTGLSADRRTEYFQEIYRRLSAGDFSGDSAAEQALLNALKQMTHADAMSLVFDADGRYGGDQMAQFSKSFILRLHVIAYYIAMGKPITTSKVEEILDSIANVGCGYVAAVNSILVQYVNDPAEFERIFGFPLYVKDANGNVKPNFNLLLVDFFLHCRDEGYDQGLGEPQRTEMLNLYLAEKGSTLDVELGYDRQTGKYFQIQNNPQYATDIMAHWAAGETVILYMQPTWMYDTDGEKSEIGSNAHAVVVTGIAANGDIIVSSWGGQWTVSASEFNDYDSLQFTTLTYSEAEADGEG